MARKDQDALGEVGGAVERLLGDGNIGARAMGAGEADASRDAAANNTDLDT